MNGYSYKIALLFFVGLVLVTSVAWFISQKGPLTQSLSPTGSIIPSATSTPIFEYTFNVDGVLEESGSLSDSRSPYWWLDSGGLMSIHDGIGSTIQGDLPLTDKWRTVYASSNPSDTDNGTHPQNIFRLISKNTWHNLRQEAYFRIHKDNLSASANRNESNGILLLSRYTDSDDLYYAGIRVDGHAIIKKKIKGEYHTLAEEPLFPGTYARDTGLSLLPKNTWIGLRSEVVTRAPDDVKIRLYIHSTDSKGGGEWKLVAEADDRGKVAGSVIDTKGYAGIRSDFMDVDFKDFKLEEFTL